MNAKVLFLTISLMTGLVFMQAVPAATPADVQKNSESVTLNVQNMTCAMCPITVRKALQAIEGVQSAKVDFGTKTASITFDPQKTNTEALIKATTNAGYPSTVGQAD